MPKTEVSQLELRPSITQLADNDQFMRNNEHPGEAIFVGRAVGSVMVLGFCLTAKDVDARDRGLHDAGQRISIVQSTPYALSSAWSTSASWLYYEPLSYHMGAYVVSNGEQTQPTIELLKSGRSIIEAIDLVGTFEEEDLSSYKPDGTPRLTGVIDLFRKTEALEMAAIRKAPHSNKSHRVVWPHEVSEIAEGVGYYLPAHVTRGGISEPYQGVPLPIPLDGTAEKIAKRMFDSLRPEYRQGVAALTVDTETFQLLDKVIVNEQEIAV